MHRSRSLFSHLSNLHDVLISQRRALQHPFEYHHAVQIHVSNMESDDGDVIDYFENFLQARILPRLERVTLKFAGIVVRLVCIRSTLYCICTDLKCIHSDRFWYNDPLLNSKSGLWYLPAVFHVFIRGVKLSFLWPWWSMTMICWAGLFYSLYVY